MSIYLPIAEVVVNGYYLSMIGFVVGTLAGIFGVGGGFLLTPLLIIIGISPPLAVGSGACYIIASSATGLSARWSKRHIDPAMALFVSIGGVSSTLVGIYLFSALQQLGQIDLFIRIGYIVLLACISVLMISDNIRIAWVLLLRRRRVSRSSRRSFSLLRFIKQALPWKKTFKNSNTHISIILPISVGVLGGFMTSLLGVGGGIIMLPAMIYILSMPATLVVGTSLMQVIILSTLTTAFHASVLQTVDMLLVALLILGGVLGTYIGSKMSVRFKPTTMRFCFALLITLLTVKLVLDVVLEPSSPYFMDTI